MSFEDVLEVIVELSYSQGMYGRLYRAIMDAEENDPAAYEEFKRVIEEQHFGSALDFILWYEC